MNGYETETIIEKYLFPLYTDIADREPAGWTVDCGPRVDGLGTEDELDIGEFERLGHCDLKGEISVAGAQRTELDLPLGNEHRASVELGVQRPRHVRRVLVGLQRHIEAGALALPQDRAEPVVLRAHAGRSVEHVVAAAQRAGLAVAGAGQELWRPAARTGSAQRNPEAGVGELRIGYQL